MKRTAVVVAVLSLVLVLALANGRRLGSAQSETSPTASAIARATAIADLQTRVAVLETRLAGGAEDTATAAPTETPVTSSSPTPTAVATVAATPDGNDTSLGPGPITFTIENGLTVLYVYAHEFSWGTSLFGEVLNTTDATVTSPSIAASLIDSSGTVIETLSLYTPLSLIPAQGRMGFEGTTQHKAEEWAEITVDLSGSNPATDAQIAAEPDDVALQNINEMIKTDSNLRVLGEVVNNEERAISLVVRALFTSADGRYAGSIYRLTNFSYLAPGESGSFKIDAFISLDPGWTYQIITDAYVSSAIPPESGEGIVEIVNGTPFTGAPTVARTGAQLISSYGTASMSSSTGFYSEMRNTTDVTINSPALYITAYDAEGKIVDSLTSYPILGIMPPGETAPYGTISDLSVDEWSRYVISINATEQSAEGTILAYAEGLVARDVEETARTETTLDLTGTIANEGELTFTYVNALVLIYRSDGLFAGSYWSTTDPQDLGPGESGTFAIKAANINAGTDWTYRLIPRGAPKR